MKSLKIGIRAYMINTWQWMTKICLHVIIYVKWLSRNMHSGFQYQERIMKPVAWIYIITLLLTACTMTSPTAPSTQVPLAELDLKEILIQRGDLPAGYVGGLVENTLPGTYDNLPKPINQIYQSIDLGNVNGGGVAIIIYNTAASANEAYDTLLSEVTSTDQPKQVEDVAEKADLTGWNMLFLRFNTLVHIRIVGSKETEYVTYAQKLDQRLIPLVCR